jgi:hypothetical protein
LNTFKNLTCFQNGADSVMLWKKKTFYTLFWISNLQYLKCRSALRKLANLLSFPLFQPNQTWQRTPDFKVLNQKERRLLTNNFEFQIPVKESGEEARLASQDYRAVHSLNQTKSAQNGGGGHVTLRKEEKTSFTKFTALKKPAPLPPVLRRWTDKLK